MATINQVKQLAAADTPILFFQCEMPTGDTYYWSSHSILFNGQQYVARIIRHNLFTLQLSADDAMDGLTQLSIVLGNADAMMSELSAQIGFRGAQLTVYFAFVDLEAGTATTESTMLFRGVSGDPEEITEETLTLNFTNKLSLQRVALPDVRIQRTCPWNFPATLAQRREGLDGGSLGRFSRFYRCGYSADIGGAGNLNAGQPFTNCDGSRAQCVERGMFNADSSGNVNNRYGGFEFIPASYLVRGAGDKSAHLSSVIDNTAKANDSVPIVYGTGWLKAPVVFARNDGNLTHMEVLLGLGPIESVLKVVVNDIEIPAFSSASTLGATGWFALVTDGSRRGGFNLDFVDSSQNPLGDPQGSMAVLSVVVPNSISPGTSTPLVQVLMSGLQVDTYDANGIKSVQPVFSSNPAWILMDVLQRAGWTPADMNLSTFYQASLFCDALISTTDVNGKTISLPKYRCNLILSKRQSAAILVRGIRVGAGLMLRYGANGLLELLPEGTLASQQSLVPDGSNSTEPLNGGWPAYEFSDATGGFSGIARNSQGGSTLKLTAANISETSNRISVEFQDESNEYQQDSLSLSNTDDSDLIGFEVASQSTALGIPNFNQATRILLRQLDKATAGNQFVQFQTSFRALKVRPGDLIALTYIREGFSRTPFRVLKISPSLNYELVTILAQKHDDLWYSDDPTVLQNAGRQANAQTAIPRPLLGTIPHADLSGNLEYFDFALSDSVSSLQDGSAIDSVTVGFVLPGKPSATFTYVPLVNLSPTISSTGGTLPGGSSWYYAVSAIDSQGSEGPLSFTIPANLPAVTNSNCVALQDLSFPKNAAAFNVYRGLSPQVLYRIASNQSLSTSFLDTGFQALPMCPPDSGFDHANFYYRNEFAGPFPADIVSASTIGWSDLGAVSGAYVSMVVLITEGTGRGQERSIIANTSSTLTLLSPWVTIPDSTSIFVIAEPAWKLVAISSNSPVQFDIPYRLGGVIQVTGRAANIRNQESNPDLGPITRMHLGGNNSDAGLPSTPSFQLAAPGAGELTVFGIGFQDLTNVQTVTSGTLQLSYWNELKTPSTYTLSQAVDASSGTITLNLPVSVEVPFVGQLIQVDQEIMAVLLVNSPGNLTVRRAAASSNSQSHPAGAQVMYLDTYTVVMPFVPGYFQNKASSNYIHTVSVPDIRVCAAQFFVSNSFGNSQAAVTSYTSNTNLLRTLSGGQFSLQVNGYLATQTNAAPPLVVQAKHATRDIRLTLGQPPVGYVLNVDLQQNGNDYCRLSFNPSQTEPTVIVDGIDLPPLMEGALLSLNLTLTAIANSSLAPNPGRDLTVTIRL